MKIGVILTGYGMLNYVDRCLEGWLRARNDHYGTHKIVICAVSVPFAGFPDATDDGTVEELHRAKRLGDIDHVIDSPKHIPETVARSMALQWLKTQGVDYTWQVDLDEEYTLGDINAIVRFVEADRWTVGWKLSLKNYVFDEQTYLAEPFQPMRIHRIDSLSGCIADGFWADNNVSYRGVTTDTLFRDTSFACKTVPQQTAWIRHITWQSNARSRDKIKYQLEARGWPSCQFAWDPVKGLIFNPALPAPRVLRDE